MDAVTNISKVVIPEFPIETNYGKWLLENPECDSISEQIGTGTTMIVYAYATSKSGNKELRELRNKMFPDKKIYRALSQAGIRTLV